MMIGVLGSLAEYASLLIRHGESVKTVQSRLGHASTIETLDTVQPSAARF
jgi:hypothetical protein